MAQPGMARPARIFFALKRLFGPTGPVFRAGWAVKILAQKNRANFGPAQPSPARPIATSSFRVVHWDGFSPFWCNPWSSTLVLVALLKKKLNLEREFDCFEKIMFDLCVKNIKGHLGL